MKKILFIFFLILLRASASAAQQEAGKSGEGAYETPFETDINVGYRWLYLTNNIRAGEYEYNASSGAGSLDLEWDPLPQRFVLESNYINSKDFYAEMDYAFRDVVILNLVSRGVFHNLDHYGLGRDDPATSSPSMSDRDTEDDYWSKNRFNRGYIRIKTPDFPLHLYAEARTYEEEGLMQQRFLDAYSGGLNKVSESRETDRSTEEVRAGINSHLGPIELDYNHMEKTFEASKEKDKILYDDYSTGIQGDVYAHNLVPDIESSSDTVKIHTSYTGRLVASATYSAGDRKNIDSGARAEYWNAAGDITYVPWTSLSLFFKYRHYDLTLDNPESVTVEGMGNATNTYGVRDSISSQRDVFTGAVRYRPADGLSLRAEYAGEITLRDVWQDDANFWEVARRTRRGTTRLGASYRIMNRLSLRADYSRQDTENPAYKSDPDEQDSYKASLTWTPAQKIAVLLSYRDAIGKRDDSELTTAGDKWEADRSQALASVTVLAGKMTSITASYMYLKSGVDGTIKYTTGANAFSLESVVPYNDTAHVGALSLSHALSEKVSVTAEASKSYSKGSFRNSGDVAGSEGIAELTDIKATETAYTAGIETRFGDNLGSAVRLRQSEYDDELDNTQDGKVQSVLATMNLRW